MSTTIRLNYSSLKGIADYPGKIIPKTYSVVDNFPAKALIYSSSPRDYCGIYRDLSVHVEFSLSKV